MQRFWITLGLLAAAGLLTVAAIMNGRQQGGGDAAPPAAEPEARRTDAAPSAPSDPSPADAEAKAAPKADTAQAAPAPADASEAAPAAAPAPLEGLKVAAVEQRQPDPEIGSAAAETGSDAFRLAAKFSPWGGGLWHVKLAPTHLGARPDDEPYVLLRKLEKWRRLGGSTFRYPLAAAAVNVNGVTLSLQDQRWRVVESNERSATFAIDIVDGQDKPVLRITRTWSIKPGDFDLKLSQLIENLSGKPLTVRFDQYGQNQLNRESTYIGDRRRVILAYIEPKSSGGYTAPLTDGYELGLDTLQENGGVLWPDPEAGESRDLVWVAVDNRYFASVLFPQVHENEQGQRRYVPIEKRFGGVRSLTWGGDANLQQVLLLEGAPVHLAAGKTHRFDLGLYVGPKDTAVLRAQDSDFSVLGLGQIVYYNLGSICAFCTWAWLAEGLLNFLRLIHSFTGDWGFAIICLVALVRLILHPLTKSSQVNMMKMSKAMQALAPELEKLKKKYEGNPQKLQQETMKLYSQKGVNPAAMGLGCLPMFLQMPIWFALYAMLYFAVELRHEPAFWGVFQQLSDGAWPFLADLSVPDRFVPFGEGFTVFGFTIKSFNILPILMAVVFYLQQRYTTAPSPQNEQQAMQQKMMKWMVMLFPIFLYQAPSGLNLYILASTTVGIIESKRVRAHLKELEEQGKLFEKKPPKPGGLMDRLAKAAEAQMKLREEQMKQAQKKKRK